MTILFLIILAVQVITAIGIIIWSLNAEATKVYSAISPLLSIIMIFSIANMLFAILCLVVGSWLFAPLFIAISIALYYGFKECNVIIPKNQNFVLYEKYDKMPVSVIKTDGKKDYIEFKEGQHQTWPIRFTIGLHEEDEHGHATGEFGFNSNSNVLNFPEIPTVSKEGISTPITGIDVNLKVDDNKTYQFDLFEYNGEKGQDAARKFVASQIRDVLMDFISGYKLKDIKTPQLIRKLVESDHQKYHDAIHSPTASEEEKKDAHEKCILGQISRHLKAFQVTNNGNPEPFEAYIVEKIKVAGINLPKEVIEMFQKQLLVDTENSTKEAQNDALRKRATANGVSVDTQKAIETDSVKKIDISGSHPGGVIVDSK